MENLNQIIADPATRVFKYTIAGLVPVSREVIQEWLSDFPHLVRGYSVNSGKFLTKTSLYKIVPKKNH
jgi:hypothetical protein